MTEKMMWWTSSSAATGRSTLLSSEAFPPSRLVTQTQAGYDYTVIIEEGLSYKKFTESLGGTPILIHPDGQLTLNYLDTQGLPLNQLQIASAVALVSKMIGESTDPEKQQLRQAQIGQYIQQLYSDTFSEWSGKHHDRLIGGTPQHSVLIGMTGAGKSFAMDDLLPLWQK